MDLSDVKKLATFQPDENLAVSLFLNINAKERRHSDIKSILNHLIDEQAKALNISHDQEKRLRNDIGKITDFFESETFVQEENRGIAIFSKASEDYFQAFYLAQPIDDRLVYSPNFFIRPLLGYLDLYGKYLAVLVDQSRGRFFEIEQGGATDYYYFRDEVPSKVREGGWYGYEEHHIERHVEDHLHQHYKKVAAKVLGLLNKHDYRWLIIAGLPEALTSFKKTLHPYVKSKLTAEIPANVTKESVDKVMQRVMNQITEIRENQHHALEHELSDKYPYKAVLGFNNVDYELEKRSVHKLLLSTDYRPVFPNCGRCDYILHEQITCPKCGADLSELDARTNLEITRAIYQDSEVHFIKNEFLEKHSGIGAILRYSISKSA